MKSKKSLGRSAVNSSEYCKRIRDIRRFKDLSQEFVAINVGVAQGVYGTWESTRKRFPPDVIERLAKFYSIPYIDFKAYLDGAIDLNTLLNPIPVKRKFGGSQPGAGRPRLGNDKLQTKCFRLHPDVIKMNPSGKLVDKLLREHYGIEAIN